MGCGFPTVCRVVAGPLSVPDTQRTGNRRKRLVSLAGRALRSCFVRLCVSEGGFVTSGQFWKIPDKILVHLGLNENSDRFNPSAGEGKAAFEGQCRTPFVNSRRWAAVQRFLAFAYLG